jgi:hypothetical protein
MPVQAKSGYHRLNKGNADNYIHSQILKLTKNTQSVTAPLLAVDAKIANLASTPRV